MRNLTPKQRKVLLWGGIVIWGLLVLKDYLPLWSFLLPNHTPSRGLSTPLLIHNLPNTPQWLGNRRTGCVCEALQVITLATHLTA